MNISVDEVTHLPECHGFNLVVNIICAKSKDWIPIESREELNSEGWADLLIKHVISVHGLPRRITSDRGSKFISQVIKDIHRKLGIQGHPSMAYHPQTDGQTERINQEMENYLRIFCSHRQDDWVDWPLLAAFAYRN